MPDDLKHHEGIRWRKGFYHWTGVTNPTRAWWEFWKPRKANIRLTFYYAHVDDELHVNRVDLSIAYA
jgi:hypothetical protein